MSALLVGTIGSVTQGSVGGAVTPAWGYGQSRARGNLLVCFVAISGSGSNPTFPGSWLSSSALGVSNSTRIFYIKATGGEAAPTVGAVAGGTISAQLAEFSGVAPFAWTMSSTGTTSPQTGTAGGADTTSGTLVLMASNLTYSVGATKTLTLSGNNGFTVRQTDNASTSTTAHYAFGYGFTTGFASAQTAVITFTTTSISDTDIAGVTFPPNGAGALTFNNYMFAKDALAGDTGIMSFTEKIR